MKADERFLYRVWLPVVSKMVTPTKLHYFRSGIAVEYSNEIGERCIADARHNILMQCTGLKDKNGKLIFEGDIVRYLYGSENEETPEDDWTICTVKWYGDSGYPAFDSDCDHDFDGSNGLSVIFQSGDYVIKVVGNIYDNPELAMHEVGARL